MRSPVTRLIGLGTYVQMVASSRMGFATAQMLGLRLLGRILAFGVLYLLTRVMSEAEYGVYIYVNSILTLIAMACGLGLEVVLLRYIPEYATQQDWGKLRGVFKRSIQLVLIASGCVCAIGCALLIVSPGQVSQDLQASLIVSLVLLPVTALAALQRDALRGFQRTTLAIALEQVARPALLIGLVLLFTLASAQNLPSSVALLSQGVALGVTIAIGMYFVRRCLANGNTSQPIEYHTRLWLQTGVAMLANFGASVLINQTDTLMIGTLHGPADAGVYATASRLALLSLFGMESIQTFAGPMIAQLYADKRYGRLQQLLSWSTIGGILLALPILLILILSGEHVLSYFGLHFVRGYPALAILCVAQFVNIATGMTGLVMNMTGHHRQLACIILCAAVANLLLSAVLIPIYGIVGAACATTISSCGWNLAAVWFIRAKLRLNLLAWRLGPPCEIS